MRSIIRLGMVACMFALRAAAAEEVVPAHSRAEIDERERVIVAAITQLPPTLRPIVLRRTRLLAVVSTAEGSFDGIATHAGDPSASLGVFQWAAHRTRAIDEGSSLSRFFGDLRRRAVRCDVNAEQAFYCAAWQQCRDAGLAVRGSRLLLDDRVVAGGAIEQAMRSAMGTAPLRAYQLIAANDWIDRIAARRVRIAGHMTLVGAVLDARGLATAVLLGVNRPSFVVPAIERAAKRVDPMNQTEFLRAFRSAAVALYRPRERNARAMRLLTSDNL